MKNYIIFFIPIINSISLIPVKSIRPIHYKHRKLYQLKPSAVYFYLLSISDILSKRCFSSIKLIHAGFITVPS